MAWYAVQLCNLHEDLRNATTLPRAKRVAACIAAICLISFHVYTTLSLSEI